MDETWHLVVPSRTFDDIRFHQDIQNLAEKTFGPKSRVKFWPKMQVYRNVHEKNIFEL